MTPERETEIRQHLATLGVFFTPTDLMIRELLEEIDHLRKELNDLKQQPAVRALT